MFELEIEKNVVLSLRMTIPIKKMFERDNIGRNEFAIAFAHLNISLVVILNLKL